MVSDLNFLSHPRKQLEEHIYGVINKSRRYSSLSITEIAALFHDLGKMNVNFQAKIKGSPVEGYSRHSNLSVLAFVYCLKTNQKEIMQLMQVENKNQFSLQILQIVAIIAHHHGDIPNFENMLNMDEINSAANFLNQHTLPFSDFMNQKLKIKINPFNIKYSEKEFRRVGNYNSMIHERLWMESALEYFSNMQFAFASLIHADKRDAGNNNYFQTEDKIEQSVMEINQSLGLKFKQLDLSVNPSRLNQLRTDIRIEATENIENFLQQNKRVYTLAAPTGSGKTFTLLSLARQIQKKNSKLGIIYALPFLSITEQVQKILEDDLQIDYLAINSKTKNNDIEKAQVAYEYNPSNDNLEKLIQLDFAEQTFDHPFIVTTFVQLFETFISNKNSTLLKLPNFANRIFLIDEVQSLPPRLYIFFAAWLDDFCNKHNSYAILSTATMPKLDFPIKKFLPDVKNPQLLFKNYLLPLDLIDSDKYFRQNVFNRYRINLIGKESFFITDLSKHLIDQNQSCLVILNTISETKLLYNDLSGILPHVILLNTHFIPEDRSKKIEEVKDLLQKRIHVVLISTQLIEAGVDIDFPIVYRDLCPLPSLIQSAGRCNRNKKIDLGQIYFFQLQKENGRPSSEIIYEKEAADFLKFCRTEIQDGIEEMELFNLQPKFFNFIRDNLTIGDFDYGFEQHANMVECVNKAQFDLLGKFLLINNDTFGEQYRYYIPKDNKDNSYNELIEVMSHLKEAKTFEERKQIKIRLINGLKALGNRLLNVRIGKNQTPPPFNNGDEKFGIRVLSELNKYSYETGLELGITNQLL